MGGYGSGIRWDRATKIRAESLPRLEIHWLNKHVNFKAPFFDYSFTCGIPITVRFSNGRLTVIYGDNRACIPINLETTPCNYGGVRYWLNCPQCHGKKGVLYLFRDQWGCRQCHNLAYACQQEQPWDRLARQADKIRDRLGWEQGCLNGHEGKPKHMHHITYTHLCFKHDDYVTRSLQAVYERFV